MHSSSDKKKSYNFLLDIRRYKYQVIASIAIIVLMILALFVWQHAIRLFALNMVPILTEDTTFLVVFGSDNKLAGKSKQLAKILNEMVGVDINDAGLILSTFEKNNAGQYGMIMRGENQYWFIKDRQGIVINQDQDLILAEDLMLSTSLIRSVYYYSSIPYVFWGSNEWEHSANSNEGDFLREKKIFSNLISRNEAAFIWPQTLKKNTGAQSVIFGGLSYHNSILRLDLSSDPDLIGMDLATEKIPESNFYLDALNWQGDIVETGRLTALLEIDLADSLFIAAMPAKVMISTGTVSEFVEDPFLEKLDWEVESKFSIEEATNFLNNIILQLSRRFPQVEKRVLPDDSTIFELKQRIDAFSETEITIETLNNGMITYPLGQISYQYQDNILNIRHGRQFESEPVENSCIFPQSSVKGRVISDREDSGLWKTLDFSYVEGYLVVCMK